MPTFETPTPISVQIELPVGDAWIKASDRTDTVVDVRPSNASSKADVSAAEQTRVEYTDGRLLVKAPKSWRRYSLFGAGPSVDVVIEVPSGSSLRAESAWTVFRSDGRLGDCRFNTGGDVRLAEIGGLDVDTSAGDITVERVVGLAHVRTGAGNVRLGRIEGAAVIKMSSGECRIGEATGDVRVNTSSGDIAVDRVQAGITARTAYGSIRIGEVVRGSITLATSYGGIDVGVRAGTAAYLDIASRSGRIHNALESTSAPRSTDETVKIHAVTMYGDITVHRS
jgi:DUF4097 and DUF4098 domain-containing protein YvlB